MRVFTLSTTKNDLHGLRREVCNNSEPAVIVGRESCGQVVLLSLADYPSLEETAYLLRSPANRAYLGEALQQVREDRAVASHCNE